MFPSSLPMSIVVVSGTLSMIVITSAQARLRTDLLILVKRRLLLVRARVGMTCTQSKI